MLACSPRLLCSDGQLGGVDVALVPGDLGSGVVSGDGSWVRCLEVCDGDVGMGQYGL